MSSFSARPLGNFAHGRDNNFNLIRMLAAFAVLFTHSFAVVQGSGVPEPFQALFGRTIGQLAVDIFFITSGFLVTASIITRRNLVDFTWARVLRIYPALIVMLLLTVFVMGSALNTIGLADYLLSKEPFVYVIRNLIMVTGIDFAIPGLYETVPYANMVNASLWTIPYELLMYTVLAVIWFVAGRGAAAQSRRVEGVIVLVCLIAALHVGYTVARNLLGLEPGPWQLARLSYLTFMFFAGAVFFLFRDKIILSHRLFLLAASTIVIATIAGAETFSVVYPLAIPYAVFYLAYVPGGLIRRYNRLGDYSYGVYIYGWPVQQATITLYPEVSILQMILIAGSVTLLLSIASWHWLEKKALAMKTPCAEQTRAWLNARSAHAATEKSG